LDLRYTSNRLAVANVAALYLGKTSGVIIAFIFLPLYNRLLGPESFGVVAVILSLQALLVMMDLGMSTLVSRDISLEQRDTSSLITLIRTAEISLTGFYALVIFGVACTKLVGVMPGLSWWTVIGSIVLFWLLVMQNLHYIALLARKDYLIGSFVQVIGTLARASATAYVLAEISATLSAFIATQVILAAIHFVVTRNRCLARIKPSGVTVAKAFKPSFTDGYLLVKEGRALVIFSAAGAAVMQLDKPLVSALVSPASVAPYFLATTLCMVPISILAGPVSQYFQPKLLASSVNGNADATLYILKRFLLSIVVVTGLPTIVFWLYRVPLIDLWLGQFASNAIIARYVGILLPGAALGALGFVPYALLLCAKDFKFQAFLSIGLTLATLMAAALSANAQSIELVCVVYAVYHTTSTMGSWIRATKLPQISAMARHTLLWAVLGSGAVIFATICINYLIH
jgi:O-antigen/teichoic acid export membrane protein